MVDADVVFGFFEDFVQAVTQGDKFFVGEKTFKDAVLGPFAKTAEEFVDFGAAFVVGDVVGD